MKLNYCVLKMIAVCSIMMAAATSSLAWSINSSAAKLKPTRTVVYKKVGNRELHLYIFDPEGFRKGDKHPCFLSIHGGGWTGLSALRQYPFAEYFTKLGMVSICVEYRLFKKGSKSTVYDCVRDARSAVRYARKHAAELGIDPNKIVVNGGSAGGHLAVATELFDGIDAPGDDTKTSCKPDALVLYSPVIDTSKEGYGNRKCGKEWRSISPLHQVKPGMPPTIIFHSTKDSACPYKGAKAFTEAMHKAGNKCELVTEKNAGHAYMYHNKAYFDKVLEKTKEFLIANKLL